jgi:two-component system phosphate regulon sensor histidine kinase PhoR
VPVLALLAAVLLGALSPGAAALIAAATLAGAAFWAWLWLRDLTRLEATLRHVASDTQDGTAPAPQLPAVTELADGIDRLSRTLRERGALVLRLLKADEAIVEKLPDPLIVLAGDRTVLRANAAARAAFGGELAAVLRHPALRAGVDRAFATGQIQRAELEVPVPVERDVDASVIPLDPPLADGGQAIVVLSDRTRERAVERMRADFVANASHELRTPLASLIGFTETLRGAAADDPAAQQRFLAIMAEQGARMNRLIDDLLSLSRIELSEHQAPSGMVDLAELVRRAALPFAPSVAARGIRLVAMPDSALQPVPGDADQLLQVLTNLIDNAVKYGREGGEVRVTAAPAGPGRWPRRPGVVVAVTDDGPGIPAAHLSRLTERFYRVDKGRSRAVGGTGLGLAIVKHIVNRHRGLLAIDSEEGKGSTFSVWLPAEPAGASQTLLKGTP